MAAGENQPKPVVLDALVVQRRGGALVGVEMLGNDLLRSKPPFPTHGINPLEPARGNQPSAWIGRYPLFRPPLQGGSEGVVQRVLGKIEVTQQADQRGENPARIRAIKCVDALIYP